MTIARINRFNATTAFKKFASGAFKATDLSAFGPMWDMAPFVTRRQSTL
jgi:hypothetical protein